MYFPNTHLHKITPVAENLIVKAFKSVFSLLHIRSANKHFREEKLFLPKTHIISLPKYFSDVFDMKPLVIQIVKFGILALKGTYKKKCSVLFKYLIIFPDQ